MTITSPQEDLDEWPMGIRLPIGLDWPILIGEACFVSGWSLMWATSLDIVPRVPVGVWLAMIILGLAVAYRGTKRPMT